LVTVAAVLLRALDGPPVRRAAEVHMGWSENRVATVRVLTLAAVLLGAHGTHAGTGLDGFMDDPVVTGLSEPTAIAFLPDGRLLVTEKAGAVKLVADGVALLAGTIPVCTASEMGLLGIAVDPDFTVNGRLYLYRTESAGGCADAAGRSNEVVRTTLDGATLGPLITLLTAIRTDNGNHDGGALRIGPDRKLYVGVGDTGLGDGGPPGASTNPYAQDLNALEGKILRLELDGSVPVNNPFAGTGGRRGEIFAYGFRNPFRFGFDPLTGALWAGDVGQSTLEEIDRVVPGGNHSWPYCEGTQPSGCAGPDDVVPAYEYAHNGGYASVTGGAFAVGGSSVGEYFFAEFALGTVHRATLDGARARFTAPPAIIVTDAGGPVDLVFGPDGALYYVAYFGGEVRRVTSPGLGPSTTTTTTTSTTTTTLPPACADAPSFGCARAGLDAIAGTITALGDLGRFGGRLEARLARSRAALDRAEGLASGGRRGAARAALRRAIRALATFRLRLTSSAGRRRLAQGMRNVLRPMVDGQAAALRALRDAM
jgi:glucose/arabinose dehydrogenase